MHPFCAIPNHITVTPFHTWPLTMPCITVPLQWLQFLPYQTYDLASSEPHSDVVVFRDSNIEVVIQDFLKYVLQRYRVFSNCRPPNSSEYKQKVKVYVGIPRQLELRFILLRNKMFRYIFCRWAIIKDDSILWLHRGCRWFFNHSLFGWWGLWPLARTMGSEAADWCILPLILSFYGSPLLHNAMQYSASVCNALIWILMQ